TASPPPEASAAPADAIAAPPADAMVTPSTDASTPPPQVAVETPADVRAASAEQQMATDPCASQSASGSMDCEKLKRKVSTDKSTKASAAVCTSHTDAKGTVIYDDPTCPSRMGGAVVTDPGSVYLIRENPFFNLHIEKAVDHAKAAEIAGNQGQAADLMEHAQMSLMQAKEAQRAGNVAGLNEGIISLREALRLPEGSSVREATAFVRDARKNLSQAGGMKYKEIQPQVAVSTQER
ncbi:MAG TPA: small metal-binding protein SmbP, partial [Nitrospira sp.]